MHRVRWSAATCATRNCRRCSACVDRPRRPVGAASAPSSWVVLPPGQSSLLKPLLHKIKTDDAKPQSSITNLTHIDLRQSTKLYRTPLIQKHALPSLELHKPDEQLLRGE